MTIQPVPQTDPRAGYFERKAEIDAAITRVLASGQYIMGREVEAFEAAFAAWLGIGHALGTGSGTDAIELALRACGIGPGDLVFTVSHTAVATVAAVERAGAVPVLVDIEPGGFTMDPACLAAALRDLPPGRPAAILPVHLFGEPAELAPLRDLASPSWHARHRGLCAEPRRGLSRAADRELWRHRLLQLLPDQEPGRAGRRGNDCDR